MEIVPFGLGWMNFILAMPLVVLAAWACHIDADDYPELMKTGVVSLIGSFILPLLVALLLGLLLRLVSDTSDSARTFVLGAEFVLWVLSFKALVALAAKRLLVCGWKTAWAFVSIVGFGTPLLVLFWRSCLG